MQPSLFDRSPQPITATPYAPSSETSREAAEKAKAFVWQQGAAVLAYVQRQGRQGATQKEISAGTGITRQSVAARVNALWERGDLVKTRARRQQCAVYRATKG